MIIAIPSVTTYISNSRKSSYIDTVKTIIGAARNLVNSGKLDLYDTSAVYYLPTSCIPTENGSTTSFGNTSINNPLVYGENINMRLMTAQEVNQVCGVSIGDEIIGELSNCNFLLENNYFYRFGDQYNLGFWLESPSSKNGGLCIEGRKRNVFIEKRPDYAALRGVRPVIDVLKIDVEY